MRLRTLFAMTIVCAIILALGISAYNLTRAAATAVGDQRATSADYVPISYGPPVDGVNYCLVRYDPYEVNYFGDYGRQCLANPERIVTYPAAAPIEGAANYFLQLAAWQFLLRNNGWVNDVWYYDHVLLPSSRHTTAIIIGRDAYRDYGRSFNTRWHSEHTRLVKTDPPKFRKAGDKSPTPKVFAGDKFATQANRAADVTKEQTAKRYGGLNPGAVADPAKAAKADKGTSTDKAKNQTTTDAKRSQRTTTYGGGTDSSRDPARLRQQPTGGGTATTSTRQDRTSSGTGTSTSRSTSTGRR